LPVGPDRRPAIAQAFLIGIAVLRDDGRDPLGMADGEPEPRRRAIIENVNGKAIKADDFGETFNHAGDIVEGVIEFFS
jgi:hypothetical protein